MTVETPSLPRRQSLLQRLADRTTRLEQSAWTAWLVLFLVVTVIAVLHPYRSDSHVYRDGALHWWQAAMVYGPGIHGFLYLPSAAVLYTPFAYGPAWLGDVLWRTVNTLLFTLGAARLASLAGNRRQTLALMLLLAVPVGGIDLLRAESELAMVGLAMLAHGDLAERRWWRAGLLLAASIAIKPLTLVMALLWAALYPRTRLPLAAGIALVLALPFANPDPLYVVHQYGAMVAKLTTAADPGNGRWNEITNLLAHFGVVLPYAMMTLLRMAAALATLAMAWLAVRRRPPAAAAIALFTLGICYQLVFNPRTEDGSYVTLAALLGLFAARALHGGAVRWRPARQATGAVLVALALALATQMYGDWIYRPTDLWLKPLVCLVVMAGLALRLAWRPLPLPAAEEASA